VRDLGHNVTGVAVTRDEAVAQAMARRPGLVLADIQLADDSSGIDAVRDILAEFSVPVIFITAFPERLLTGELPEPTFLITKPFEPREHGRGRAPHRYHTCAGGAVQPHDPSNPSREPRARRGGLPAAVAHLAVAAYIPGRRERRAAPDDMHERNQYSV